MAQQLGQVAVGSIVKLNENGSPVEFYVAKHDYESGLNGAGRTLVVRTQHDNSYQKWDAGNSNAYAQSDVDSWLNGDYKSRLDPDILSVVPTTKIRYTPVGNGSSSVSTLDRQFFLLSATEFGLTSGSLFNVEGSELPISGTLIGENPDPQWTRSPCIRVNGTAIFINASGDAEYGTCNTNHFATPAFTLPSDLSVLDGGTIIVPPNPPATLTVPQMAMQGNQIAVSWSAVDGADGYILERKANTDADWTQVYSGANTSFEETVGTWTSVQYRVKAGVSGTYGDYTTSASVPVVSASAVVISGTDGDLGTLTNDVTYTVSSDGTNPLTVVEIINGMETRTYTATNGATNKIPVVDLPTGYGTITITATTQATGGAVTVTRAWTYTKGAITFPDAGSVADLIQNGKTIWAKTIAEAVRAPGIWGGNLGLALSKLAGSVIYHANPVAKYTEVVVDMNNVTEGQIVTIPVNGVAKQHYVASLNYEQGLNGAGKRLLVPVSAKDTVVFNSTNTNIYANGTLDTWLNTTYKATLPSEIQEAMGTTKFYYTPGGGNYTVTTYERSMFVLSLTEFGLSEDSANVEGTALPIADTIRSGASNWWTRTPRTIGADEYAFVVTSYGEDDYRAEVGMYAAPCFTLPSTFSATYYFDGGGTVKEEQEYEEAGSFTDILGNSVPALRIETGIYSGTGTYGESSPNTLNFSFEPKVVFVMSNYVPTSATKNMPEATLALINGAWGARTTFGLEDNQHYGLYLTWNGNSLKFYNLYDAERQFNFSGRPYIYVAIGLAGGESA